MPVRFKTFMTSVNKNYLTSTEAIAVYNYLNLNESIAKMLVATMKERPALEGVVDDLEAIFIDNKDFDFKKDEVRQCIGRMVLEIMSNSKYASDKDMPLVGKKFFKNAMRYK